VPDERDIGEVQLLDQLNDSIGQPDERYVGSGRAWGDPEARHVDDNATVVARERVQPRHPRDTIAAVAVQKYEWGAGPNVTVGQTVADYDGYVSMGLHSPETMRLHSEVHFGSAARGFHSALRVVSSIPRFGYLLPT
jgi:hypothetical protein